MKTSYRNKNNFKDVSYETLDSGFRQCERHISSSFELCSFHWSFPFCLSESSLWELIIHSERLSMFLVMPGDAWSEGSLTFSYNCFLRFFFYLDFLWLIGNDCMGLFQLDQYPSLSSARVKTVLSFSKMLFPAYFSHCSTGSDSIW